MFFQDPPTRFIDNVVARLCNDEQLLTPEDTTGLTPYFGICNIAFGMPGSTTPETERVMPKILIVTQGTQLNFLVSAYASQNTTNGGVHEVAIYDNGTNFDDILKHLGRGTNGNGSAIAGVSDTGADDPGVVVPTPCPAGTQFSSGAPAYAVGCQNGVDWAGAPGQTSGAGYRLLLGPDVDFTNLAQRTAGLVDASYQFNTPGTYLVICNIRNHFLKRGMHIYVEVRAASGPPVGPDPDDTITGD